MKLVSSLAFLAVLSVHVRAASVASIKGARVGSRINPTPAPPAPAPPAPAPAPSYYTPPPTTASAPYTAPASAPAPAPAAPAPADDSYVGPMNQCWTETKRCCYEEQKDGYECRDDYATRQARCHPRITYKRKCDKAEISGKPESKPDNRVDYSDTEVVHYDSRYGPHVEGYPANGQSDMYTTDSLPERPHGVTAEPYAYVAPTPTPSYVAGPAPAPQGEPYVAPAPAPAPAPTSADGGYVAPGSGSDGNGEEYMPPATAPAPAYVPPSGNDYTAGGAPGGNDYTAGGAPSGNDYTAGGAPSGNDYTDGGSPTDGGASY